MFRTNSSWVRQFPRSRKTTGTLPFHLCLGYEMLPDGLSRYYTQCGNIILSSYVQSTAPIEPKPDDTCHECAAWFRDHYQEYKEQYDEFTRNAQRSEGKAKGPTSREKGEKAFYIEQVKRRIRESGLRGDGTGT